MSTLQTGAADSSLNTQTWWTSEQTHIKTRDQCEGSSLGVVSPFCLRGVHSVVIFVWTDHFSESCSVLRLSAVSMFNANVPHHDVNNKELLWFWAAAKTRSVCQSPPRGLRELGQRRQTDRQRPRPGETCVSVRTLSRTAAGSSSNSSTVTSSWLL